MPIPEIGPMPPAPIRGADSREDFASKANDMMARLPSFRDELEAFRVAVNDVIPTLNGASDLKADLESLNDQSQDLIDQLTLNYSEQRVELGGDFNPGQEIVCVRTGNVVTITSVGPPLHSTGKMALSPSFTIPVGFRPSTDIHVTISRLVYADEEYVSSGLASVQAGPDGHIRIIYRDYDGAVPDLSYTSPSTTISLNYVVTSQVP